MVNTLFKATSLTTVLLLIVLFCNKFYPRQYENGVNSQYEMNQKALLFSENTQSESLFGPYAYDSQNYYGKLKINDYMPKYKLFDQFQKPNNVNIQGLPWNESLYTLSFVVPIYNKIEYLDAFFTSILTFTNNPKLNPTNEKYEIVVVDANSNDGSYEYLLELASILNSENRILPNPQIKPQKIADNPNNDFFTSLISKFVTSRKSNQSNSFRYLNIKITDHKIVSKKVIKNEKQSKYINLFKINIGTNNNARLRIIRRNTQTLSNIARQIGVEYSMGRYIWQIDPDDQIITKNANAIANSLMKEISTRSDKAASIVKFGYCQYTYENGVLPKYPDCFERFDYRIESHYDVAFDLVHNAGSWQLWQSIIRRDTFLKGIESVKLHAPEQEKIIVADDLFLYSASVAYADSMLYLPILGYNYFYMRPGSESLKIWKDNLNTRLSTKVIVTFIHYMFDNMSIPFHPRFSEL